MRNRFLQTRYLVLYLVILILLLLVVIFGQTFIRDEIVIPFEYILWLAGLAVRAVPQYIFWAILCGLALALGLRGLLVGKPVPPLTVRRVTSRSRSERVAFWALQVQLLSRGGYSRIRFAEFFGKLVMDILTYTGQIDPTNDKSYETFLANEGSETPGEILEFLEIRNTPISEIQSPGFLKMSAKGIAAWFTWLANRLSRRNSTEIVVNPHELELQAAVVYLEHELEVNNNQNGN